MIEVEPAALAVAAAAVRGAASDVVAAPLRESSGTAVLDAALQRFAASTGVVMSALTDLLHADADALLSAATEYAHVDATAVTP